MLGRLEASPTVLSQRNLEAVVGELHAGGEGGVGGGVAEVVADVGEEGAAGAEFFGDGDCFVEGEVGDVGAVAEGVEDQDVEPFQQRQAFVRDAVGVGAVGEVADAKAEDFEAGAVLEADG